MKEYSFTALPIEISDRYPKDIKDMCGGKIYGSGFYADCMWLPGHSDVTMRIVDIIPERYGDSDSDAAKIIQYFSRMISEGPIKIDVPKSFLKEALKSRNNCAKRFSVSAKRLIEANDLAHSYIMDQQDPLT